MIIIETFQVYGETYPYEWIRFDEETRLWYMGRVTCTGSVAYGGTCQCISHDPEEEWIVGREEVKQILQDLLDKGQAFDLSEEEIESLNSPSLEDKVMEKLALRGFSPEHWKEELEDWLSSSYKIGLNPLPALRKVLGGDILVLFKHQDDYSFFSLEEGEEALVVTLDSDDCTVDVEFIEE